MEKELYDYRIRFNRTPLLIRTPGDIFHQIERIDHEIDEKSLTRKMICLKMLKKIKIRYFLWFTLFSMFIWWAAIAVIKFWDQPLVTDIITSFGDNKNGIQYPLITFCSENFRSNMKACKIMDESSFPSFFDKIVKCVKNDKNFKIDSFLENLPDERKTVFDMVSLWDGSEYIDLQYLDDQLWSRVFHKKWGPCFTFDLSRTKEFEYVPYKRIGRPGIEFSLTENNPWSKLRILLHSQMTYQILKF
jgi:hypothetical protein